MKNLNELALDNGLTISTIRKYIKQGYTFMVIGVTNDETVDRRYAKHLGELPELEAIISGDSVYTVRLSYVI